MTPFELIVLVVIGDLIQQGVTQNDFGLTGATIAVSTIAFWALVMSWPATSAAGRTPAGGGAARDRARRRGARGQPAPQPADAVGDRVGDAAGRHLAGSSDVAWGILEARGKISFIRRAEGAGGDSRPAAEGRRGRRRGLRAEAVASAQMTSRWADELAFATDLARRAGALLPESYERLGADRYKSKRDVVTNADYASNGW